VVAAAAPDARSSCALTAVSDHSGLSANRAGVLNAQSWRLIIVWLEVRVLPAPPRSLTQTEISRLIANNPDCVCDDLQAWRAAPAQPVVGAIELVVTVPLAKIYAVLFLEVKAEIRLEVA
jgi:hypothetical protein